MLIAPRSRLIMIGDSITDSQRLPEGEGLFEGIGRGYVAYVDALLGSTYPAHAIRVTNMGISGNTCGTLPPAGRRTCCSTRPTGSRS